MVNCYRIGDDIEPEAYTLKETKAFHRALGKVDYADYVRSFKWSDERYPDRIEGIEFDIKTSAFSKSNILNTERTCAIFAKDKLPVVFALRKDFPREILHVNLLPKGLPVSPCLYEEPYSEIRLWLTWESFIERISTWFMRASDGTSHLPNQAIEPLILNGMSLLVSNSFFDTKQIYFVSQVGKLRVCRPIELTKALPQDAGILIPINTEATVSRCIHYAPAKFRELNEIAKGLGVNLRWELSEFTWKMEQLLDSNIKPGLASDGPRKKFIANEFNGFYNKIKAYAGGMSKKSATDFEKLFSQLTNTTVENKKDAKQTLLSWMPMIWFRLPKKRSEEGQEEGVENIAFLISESLGELCAKIGIYAKQDDHMIHEKTVFSTEIDESELAGDIAEVCVVKPVPGLDVNMAQKLSDIKKDVKKYLAVGAGALGSQVITNLTRLGIGNWDVLDHDILLPHNLGRHALFAEHATFPKATTLSNQLNSLMDDTDFSKPILRNFLGYKDSLADYDLIFDFSASTAVVRHMATQSKRPAITSAFMTKNGRYLIALSESKDKTPRVDDIEYQLACACVNDKGLNSVLEVHDEKEIRYSGACSDITTVLPQDRVAVHSGILSSHIKQDMEGAEPQISIWELTEDCMVNRHTVLTSKIEACHVKGWDIRVSEAAIEKMMVCRAAKLPVETGGVLIGGFDLHNIIVYIVDIIPSPKDSIEKPYSYIRGFEGLKEKVEKINHLSGRRLDYIGEWHTHQKGVRPSQLDKLALTEQVAEMSLAGLPAIMVIIGNKGKYKILLKQD